VVSFFSCKSGGQFSDHSEAEQDMKRSAVAIGMLLPKCVTTLPGTILTYEKKVRNSTCTRNRGQPRTRTESGQPCNARPNSTGPDSTGQAGVYNSTQQATARLAEPVKSQWAGNRNKYPEPAGEE
jgi:hypothetical protein